MPGTTHSACGRVAAVSVWRPWTGSITPRPDRSLLWRCGSFTGTELPCQPDPSIAARKRILRFLTISHRWVDEPCLGYTPFPKENSNAAILLSGCSGNCDVRAHRVGSARRPVQGAQDSQGWG